MYVWYVVYVCIGGFFLGVGGIGELVVLVGVGDIEGLFGECVVGVDVVGVVGVEWYV